MFLNTKATLSIILSSTVKFMRSSVFDCFWFIFSPPSNDYTMFWENFSKAYKQKKHPEGCLGS